MYILRIGNLYLSYLSIDNYDNSINISFTCEIEEAKRIKPETTFIYKSIIENFMFIENIESIFESKEEINEEN